MSHRSPGACYLQNTHPANPSSDRQVRLIAALRRHLLCRDSFKDLHSQEARVRAA